MKRTPLKRRTPMKRVAMPRQGAKPSKLQKKKDDPGSLYWRNKCDTLWSILIRKGGTCEKCGIEGRMEAHHLLTRSRKHLRHKIENGICLCCRCHKFGAGSFHEDPVAATQWLANAFPDRYQWVMDNKHRNFFGKPDYKSVLEGLQAIQEAL